MTEDQMRLANMQAAMAMTSAAQHAQWAPLQRGAPLLDPEDAALQRLLMQNAHPQWHGPNPKPPSALRRLWWRLVRAFWA